MRLDLLGRMLVSAVVRRALWRSPRALLIVAALVGLALMSIGTARAQTSCPSPISCTIEQAHAVCMAATAGNNEQWRRGPNVCDLRASERRFLCSFPGVQSNGTTPFNYGCGSHYFTAACPANAPWDSTTGTCKLQCTSRSDITVNRPPFSPAGLGSPSSFGQCSGGCYVHFTNMQDGTYVGVHTSNVQCDTPGQPDTETCTAVGRVSGVWGCVNPPQECTAGQHKDPVTGECAGSNCPAGMSLNALGECRPESNTCPPGQIKAPNGSCLPGEGQCASGEARGKDGTCKRDTDGDGVPDSEQGGEGQEPGEDEDGNSFSGGDSCNAPPSCNGNPILCGQARIQWRIDCNTRTKVNITGGTCGAVPQCVGENCNAMEQAQLLQQWRAACLLEKMAQGTPSPGNNGQPDWTKVDGMNTDAGAGETASDREGVQTREAGMQDINTGGLVGGGSSCPAIMSISGGELTSGFAATMASPPPYFCDFIGWIKLITILATAAACAYIFARGG